MIDGPRLDAAEGPAKRLVVILHGYGADGQDLIGLAPHLQDILPDADFVAPNGPERCANNPMGYQWFPIPWLDGSSEDAMAKGFMNAEAVINAFLDAELAARGLDESGLILMGFSQGTMMSLHVGLRRAKAPIAIVGFSGRLATGGDLAAQITVKPPILLVHGEADPMIPVDAMHDTRNQLAAAGLSVQWHVSPGAGHTIAPDGLMKARQFLQAL